MAELKKTKSLLDEINAVIVSYDPVLREKARDILLRQAFGDGKTSLRDRTRPNTSDLPPQEGSYKAHLGSYIGRWSPNTQADRALLCLYYLQKTFGFQSVSGHQLTEELKAHRLHVANISVAMKDNVRLLRARSEVADKRRGGTKQARNEYSITNTGLLYVEGRLSRAPDTL